LALGQGPSMCGMNATTKQATRTAVTATGLRKAYGEKVVLDGVDLRIEQGEVFALLGPNGAGKTTTVQILSTLIAADAGAASVMGHDLRDEAGAVRRVIGVTGQFSAVDDLLTGEENLLLMGRLLHVPDPDRFAAAIAEIDRGLQERAEELLRTRERIAQLGAGDRLFVSAEVADYLDRLLQFGVSQRSVQMERDIWILLQSISRGYLATRARTWRTTSAGASSAMKCPPATV
jgi:ABC-type lipopolysaccharide export system ATPase subunit